MKSPAETSLHRLAPYRFFADPLADETISRILSGWQTCADGATERWEDVNKTNFERIKQINSLMRQWKENGKLKDWQPEPVEGFTADPLVVAELQKYLNEARALPSWMDKAKVEAAEELFIAHGLQSCMVLFCASLPECYVVPDLAAVLHIAGQLEERTEHRIRSTAAMIFPVMIKGGLTDDEGTGVAQMLKVRLIHATIRHAILRGNPQAAVKAQRDIEEEKANDALAALAPARDANDKQSTNMFHALYAHGWNLKANGVPCNQEELAYTLLSFSYVFLRSMRKLNQALTQEEEEAYLHIWNVVGHMLGIEKDLMCHTMEEAKARFTAIQACARAIPVKEDARAGLGRSLMRHLEDVMPSRVLKAFPALMTQYLCGAETSRDIGIKDNASFIERSLFMGITNAAFGIDQIVRTIKPQFSLACTLTHIFGPDVMAKALLQETRQIQLPAHVSAQISKMMRTWGEPRKVKRA